MTDTLPPHDEKAEWSILACAVSKPEIIPAIPSEMFFVEQSRRVLLKMQSVWLEKQACLVSSELFEHQLSKMLTYDQFRPLMLAVNELASPNNWIYWRTIISDAFKARQLEKLKPKITEVSERVARGETPDSILLEITNITRLWQGQGPESMESIIPKVLEQLEYAHQNGGKYPGYITGFKTLDWMTCGLQNNKLYVIAGRPGVGKTTLCTCIAVEVAKRDVKTMFISLEMDKVEIGKRIVSYESGVPTSRFERNGATERDFSQTGLAMGRIKKLPLSIDDKCHKLSEIILACHNAVAEGAKLIVIDYLQKIQIPNFRFNRNELVTHVCGTIKDLAMTLRVPIICCAQLNRESEKQDREPIMADLRDSGSVEQDADFVGLLHAKSAYETDLIVVKNRSGETGRIAFEFYKEVFKFKQPDA